MSDKQQDLKKIHKRITQIYLMVRQLGEYVGWEGGEFFNIDQTNFDQDFNDLTTSECDQENLFATLSSETNSFSSQHHHSLSHHKDILADDESLHHSFVDYSNSSNNVNISCEEQVNRLTAQLTAAYARIACLEEQLLSARIQDKSQ